MAIYTIIDSKYSESEKISLRTKKEAQELQNKGYKVIERKELGKSYKNWDATKKAQALFEIGHEENVLNNIDLTDTITKFYNRKKISRELYDKFLREIEAKKVRLCFSSDKEFVIEDICRLFNIKMD